MKPKNTQKTERGFTLVELAVVVVIIGVLAAFAVPQFLESVERSKASESFNYLSSVASAQARHQARNSIYANQMGDLDIKMPSPKNFTVGSIKVPAGERSLETGWQLALTRSGASAGYGDYTVVYNHEGFDAATSTIKSDLVP